MAPGKILPSTESVAEPQVEQEIVTSILSVPVTEKRKPYISFEKSRSVPHPGVPRANIAPTVEKPEGTVEGGWAEDHKHQTVLQQHFDYFCLTEKGVIYPWDTFNAFRSLDYNLPLTLLSVFIIHINFSYPTQPPSRYLPFAFAFPDPFFRIYLEFAHKAKHGSDSGTYDNEGRFVPQKFEDMFEKYCEREGKDGMTVWDVWRLVSGQRVVGDVIGWGGGIFEWGITYVLLWPEDGIMRKEDIRRVFDGSIFHEMADRRERQQNTVKMSKTESGPNRTIFESCQRSVSAGSA